MTAVEWLIEQIESCKITMYNDGDRKKLISLVKGNLIEQAKEMEKQQIIDAVNQIEFDDIDGMGICDTNTKGEQYYNETYGSKGSDETKTDKI
jgi:hypothetical protein